MASLKIIRKRITSVKSTQKITKAMKMVSAAKLRRAQEAATAARPYAEKLTELLKSVAGRVDASAHPLLQERPETRSVDLLLVTADRGLCGGYNTNLIRRTEQFVQEYGAGRVRLTIVGRRGFDYFKKRPVTIADKHVNLFGGPNAALAEALATQLARAYAEGTTDGVFLLYSAFKSPLVQTPTVEKLLPLSSAGGGEATVADCIFEPTAAELLDRLLRRYVTALILHGFLEAIASEHGARMTAMDSATSNASDMISRLTLEMNRARQASITTELMEIIGGAEALKG